MVMTRTISTSLCAILFTLPHAGAAGRPIVGELVRSAGTTVNGATVLDGQNLVAGDTLRIGRGGSAFLRFTQGAQVSLSDRAALTVSGTRDEVSVRLTAGSLLAEQLGTKPIQVETAKCQVSAAKPGRAVYVVAIVPSQGTLVESHQGAVSVTQIASGKIFIVQPGHNTLLADAAGQEKEGGEEAPGKPAGQAPAQPAAKAKHSNAGIIAVVVAGGAAAGVGLALAGGKGAPASPSGP
jgi:hypothetical protein